LKLVEILPPSGVNLTSLPKTVISVNEERIICSRVYGYYVFIMDLHDQSEGGLLQTLTLGVKVLF